MQFSDRLAAKVELHRYMLETMKNDNITLSWSTKRFEVIDSRPTLVLWIDKYLSNIDSQIDFDQKFIEVVETFIKRKKKLWNLNENEGNCITKEEVILISNLFNKTVQYIEPAAEKFIEEFKGIENMFLSMNFDQFEEKKDKYDEILKSLYLEKTMIIDLILDLLWYIAISLYHLSVLCPGLTYSAAYEKLEIDQDLIVVKSQDQVYKLYHNIKLFYFNFNTSVNKEMIYSRFPESMATIAKYVRKYQGLFVTKNTYEEIMKSFSFEIFSSSLCMAFEGYDFEISMKLFERIVQDKAIDIQTTAS